MMWKALAVGTAAAGAGLLLRSAYEKGHFLVEELTIVSPKIQENHTFVFLTDLHDNEFGPRNRKLLEAIQAEKPEGILIGDGKPGDYRHPVKRANRDCACLLCSGQP